MPTAAQRGVAVVIALEEPVDLGQPDQSDQQRGRQTPDRPLRPAGGRPQQSLAAQPELQLLEQRGVGPRRVLCQPRTARLQSLAQSQRLPVGRGVGQRIGLPRQRSEPMRIRRIFRDFGHGFLSLPTALRSGR